MFEMIVILGSLVLISGLFFVGLVFSSSVSIFLSASGQGGCYVLPGLEFFFFLLNVAPESVCLGIGS